MGKENLSTLQPTLFEQKLWFIEEAVTEGALDKLPPKTTPSQWERQQNIGITYAFSEETLENLGVIFQESRAHPLIRENVRQISNRFMINLRDNSSVQLQASVPREVLLARKPPTQKSREKNSEKHGGLSLRVKELAEKGIKDPKEIKRTLGISTESLAGARTVLRGWGIEIPRESQPIQELTQIAQTENDDKKLQETLNRFSYNSLRGFLDRDREHKILTTVLAAARAKGFFFHNRQVKSIAEKIKEVGIPIRQIGHLDKNGKLRNSYYVVYTKHTDRIAKVLENDPDLQRFRQNKALRPSF